MTDETSCPLPPDPKELEQQYDERYARPNVRGPDAILPFGDHLLLRRWPAATKTDGGLELPDSAQKILNIAWVWAIGPDVPEGIFQIGDALVLPPYAAVPLPEQICGERMLIVRYKDLYGQLTPRYVKEKPCPSSSDRTQNGQPPSPPEKPSEP